MHYRNMRAIPTYALYGETDEQPAQDWLHWETIQSRSRLFNYRIAPHRHEQFFQLLWLTHGMARATIDGVELEIAPPAIVIVPALTVHGYEFNPDVGGVVITLMERDLGGLGLPPPAAGVLGRPDRSVTDALHRLIAEADRPGRSHDVAMRANLALLLVAMARAEGQPAGDTADRARAHVETFRRLVDERFRLTRRIADYAGAIGISPTHLNRVCRQVLGHSALAVIERRIALEARRQLVFSTLSVKQIGAELGYDDPAYFSRTIARLLGEAPAVLRERTRSRGSQPHASR